jgi:signal transduction histidine kinase
LKIAIRDTGAGIPEENLARIFDPYYSTKDTFSQKGLGLGLAVCYSVIKKHDGLITVESRVGEGTTFHIYLPAVRRA